MTAYRTIKVENIKVSPTYIFCCLNRESQKLVPSRNFSHLEPQKFVPENHKKSPIRKIKLRKIFVPSTRYISGVDFAITSVRRGSGAEFTIPNRNLLF